MSATSRRAFTTVLALVAVGLAGAAVAWACTPSAAISVSPASGPAGTRVMVDGALFPPGKVEIRWNGADGPSLATATGPTFAVDVTIPAAPVGTYTIVAVARDGSDAVAGQAVAAFTLPGPERGASENGAPSPAGAPGRVGTTFGATGEGDAARGRNAATTRGRADVPTSDGAGARAPINAGGVVTLPSGQPAFTGSFAPSRTQTAPFRKPANAESDPRSGRGASQRAAAGDLWSGFASPTGSASLRSNVGPAEGPGSVFALGIAFLAIGLATVLGGFAMAWIGKRRATSGRRGANA